MSFWEVITMIDIIVHMVLLLMMAFLWRKMSELEDKMTTLNEGEKVKQIREILEVED